MKLVNLPFMPTTLYTTLTPLLTGGLIALALLGQLPVQAEGGFTQTKQVDIDAHKQLFEPDGTTTFKGDVHVTYGDYQIFSDQATLELSSLGEPSLATFYPRPLATHVGSDHTKEDTLRGDEIRIHLLNDRIEAEGDTVSYVTSVAANPVKILADTQQFNNNTHTVKAHGHVQVTTDGTHITSPTATMWLSEGGKAKKVVFSGGATATKSNSTISSGILTMISGSGNMVAENNVKTHVRTKGANGHSKDVYIYSAYQQYDNIADTMLASGNVKIDYGDYKTSGPKASFRMKGGQVDTILLTGRSTITTHGRRVTGDKITITTQPQHFDAVGHVKSQFLAKSKPATPAPAIIKPTTPIKKPRIHINSPASKQPKTPDNTSPDNTSPDNTSPDNTSKAPTDDYL